jgi:hypothetical protein
LEDQLNIHIPASIEDATARLTGLESLLTATEWEKAAIVAAFVTLGEGRGKANVKSDISCAEFASLGIAGLKSHNTVRRYVEAWTIEAGLTPPLKGQDVDLPDMPFPSAPADRSGGQTGGVTVDRIVANPAKVAEAILADPTVAAHAREALEERVERNALDWKGKDPATREREESEDSLRKHGPGLVEVVELGVIADKLKTLSSRFVTPESGNTRYTDSARAVVGEDLAKAQASLDHIRAVVFEGFDTRIPDDISSLVSE